MAYRNDPVDMGYDEDDLMDRQMPDEPEPPAFPPNLCFTIDEADLVKAAGETGKVGDVTGFAAMAEVTSVHQSTDGDRVELRLTDFAGSDGKFNALSNPGNICFCCYELEKMGLDADCEVGDMIHLIGAARLEGVHRSEYGETATLQITALTFEDESEESRQGE